MNSDKKSVMECMTLLGISQQEVNRAGYLYEAGEMTVLTSLLRRLRFGLIEEMHNSQKKVDCMDLLISEIETSKMKH